MNNATRRLNTSFAAWQSTVGYICQHHSPDVILKLQVQTGPQLLWTATVTWEHNNETVKDCTSLGEALTRLWRQVDQHHVIFPRQEDAWRRPIGYAEHEVLDVSTQDVLHRFIWTTQSIFNNEWSLVIFYQPTEVVDARVNMRLFAHNYKVGVGSKGASLLDAAHELFRKAIPIFAEYAEYSERHDNK